MEVIHRDDPNFVSLAVSRAESREAMEQITRGIAIGREKLDRSQIIEKRSTAPQAKKKQRKTDSSAAHTE